MNLITLIPWGIGFIVVAGILIKYAGYYKKVNLSESTKPQKTNTSPKPSTQIQKTYHEAIKQQEFQPALQDSRHTQIFIYLNVLLLLILGLTYLVSKLQSGNSVEGFVNLITIYVCAGLFGIILWLEFKWKLFVGPTVKVRIWVVLLALRVLGVWIFFNLIAQWLGPNPGAGVVLIIIPLYALMLLCVVLPIQLVVTLIKRRPLWLWGKNQ